MPINDLVFVHDIFTRAHATRYATAEAAEPPCSFTDLLVPLGIGMSTINNNIWFSYESNQTKDVWSEVGRGGSPHSTAHCGVRRTELRDKNPDRIRIQHKKSKSYRRNIGKSKSNMKNIDRLWDDRGHPLHESARTRARQNELNQHNINKNRNNQLKQV